MSLPDFKEKCDLQYDQTLNLYLIFGIKPRTLKEAVNTQTKKEKAKQTCLENMETTDLDFF